MGNTNRSEQNNLVHGIRKKPAPFSLLALDIGGANLKASDGDSLALSAPFPLWKNAEKLPKTIRALIDSAGGCDHLVISMTGELADCYANKKEGVEHIIQASEEAAAGQPLHVYLKDGSFVSPSIARNKPPLAAASNWHALAKYAGRFAKEGPALLIDVGSTTCDIIPLLDGIPSHNALDDTNRLIAGELVYSGIERSPLFGVAARVPYRGEQCPLAQELFATMRDVYIVLGALDEEVANTSTADGRPATKEHAVMRLGRALCADESQFNHDDAVAMATKLSHAQAELLADAIRQVVQSQNESPLAVILSGHGDFLSKRAIALAGLDTDVLPLKGMLGPEISRSAAAYALAVLAREASLA